MAKPEETRRSNGTCEEEVEMVEARWDEEYTYVRVRTHVGDIASFELHKSFGIQAG